MNVFEIGAKIKLDTADYIKNLSKAERETSGFGDAIKGAFSASMKIGAEAIGMVANGVTTLSKAFVDGVSDLATYGDHVDKQSQKLGISAQAYQEWSAVMEHSGTSIDSMTMAMKTLSVAAETNSDAFAALGMDLEEVKKMSSEELFEKTITALQNMESGSQRTYLASQLLGRGATELGALLNTSAEDTEKMKQRVHELGGVMSDEAIKNSARFKDSLQDMKTAIGGLTKGIKSEFLPYFADVMDGVTKIFAGEEGGESLINKGIVNIMSTLSKSVDKIKPVIVKLGESAFKLIESNVPRIAIRGARLLGKIATEIIRDLPDILSNAGDLLLNVGEEIGSQLLSVLPDFLSEDIKSIFGSVKDFVGNIDFDKLKDTFGKLKDSLEPLIETISGGVAWAFENVLKPFGEWLVNDALPPAIDILSAAFQSISDVLTILEPIGKAVWEEFLSPFFSILGEVSEGTLKMLSGVFQTMADTFKDFDTIGFIDDIMQGRFGENWQAGIRDIAQSISDFGDEIDDFFSVNGVAQTWSRVWQDVGSAIYDASVIICDAFENIINANKELIDSISKAPAFISGYFDYLLGGQVNGDKSSVHHRGVDSNADGGYVSTPRLSWVAEKEPEYIIPESKMDKVFGRGGNTYNITVNMDGSGSTEEQAHRLAELSIEQIRAIGGTGY